MGELQHEAGLSPAEEQLLNPRIQEGLREALLSIEAEVAGYEAGGATVDRRVMPGLTDDGTYVEVLDVASYLTYINGAGLHDSNGGLYRQLIVKAFRLSDTLSPTFRPTNDPVMFTMHRPLPTQKASLLADTRYYHDDGEVYFDTPEDAAMPNDEGRPSIVTYRGEAATPFHLVLEKLGIDLTPAE